MTPTWVRVVAGMLAAVGLAAPARAALIHSQADLAAPATSWGGTVANDFTLTTTTTLSQFRIWARQGSGLFEPTLTNFSGTVGWAVYTNTDNGFGGVPGTLVAFGQDTAVGVTATDHIVGSTRDYQLDGSFAGVVVGSVADLAPGTYWFSVQEGPWKSIADGTPLSLTAAGTVVGSTNMLNFETTTPGFRVSNGLDNAFELFSADPVATPAPPGLLLALSGILSLGGFGWLRRRRPVTPA